ncbi:MAG: methyltransferase family protein [Candidatus Saccharibacteria bacterium]
MHRTLIIRSIAVVAALWYIIDYLEYELPTFEAQVTAAFVVLYLVWDIAMRAIMIGDVSNEVRQDNDDGTFMSMQISYAAILLYSVFDFLVLDVSRIRIFEPWIVYAGFVLFIIHALLKSWAWRHLGKYYHFRAVVLHEQAIISTGPYEHVRHPMYTATILFYFSIPLIFSSWGGLILALVFGVASIYKRIMVEEAMMNAVFGDQYKEYTRQTGKLLPRWRG